MSIESAGTVNAEAAETQSAASANTGAGGAGRSVRSRVL